MRNLLQLSVLVISTLFFSCKSKTETGNKEYDFEMTSVIIQEADSADKSTMDIQSFYKVKLAGEEKGLTVVELTYSEMLVRMSMMGMNVDVDTRKPFVDSTEDDVNMPEMMARIFYGVKGKTITLLVDKEGNLAKIEGLDSLKSAVVNDAGIPPAFSEAWTMMFDQQFNEENLKNQFQRFFIVVPSDKRKVGGNWVRQTLPAGMTWDTHYTVSAIEKDQVNLLVESTFRADDVSSGVTGNEKGTMTAQANTGLVTQSDITSTINTANAEGNMVMKISTKVNSKPSR